MKKLDWKRIGWTVALLPFTVFPLALFILTWPVSFSLVKDFYYHNGEEEK